MTGSEASIRRPPVLQSKLTAPTPPTGAIVRGRLSRRLAEDTRVALVVGPPGYGKTVAVRHWLDSDPRQTAWLAVDLLDASAAAFWLHLVRALRTTLPSIDDEPELVLRERLAADAVFLSVLIAQLERSDESAVIVLDDLSQVSDRAVYDGLATLVERVGHVVRFVITSRADPAFPSARWRSLGWLTEVREEDLRLDDREAIELAATFGDLSLRADIVSALNARAEGWAAGLHLALLSLHDVDDVDRAAWDVAGSDRMMADYLVADVVERLPELERDVALALSVLEWFDPELCAALLGPDAVPVARTLYRRRLFLRVIDETSGAMRFHALFRELLESELRWRLPDRRISLHRRAAELWRERGELSLAYSHLSRIGDIRSAGEMVIGPAFELVDRGDRAGLLRLVRLLPSPEQVDDPWMALDCAVVCFSACQQPDARAWCDRADTLLAGRREAPFLRLHATRAVLALMSGELEECLRHDAVFERDGPSVDPAGPFESWIPVVAVRAALVTGDLDRAAAAATRARVITEPPSVTAITVPGLEAWVELESGDLRTALEIVDRACVAATELGVRLHHGVFEAHAIAAWCHLEAGDLVGAEHWAEQASADADELGWPWNRVRAGVLVAELARLTSGPAACARVLHDLETRLEPRNAGELWCDVARVAVAGLLDEGDLSTAAHRLDDCGAGPRRTLLAARLARLEGDARAVKMLVGPRFTWSLPSRLEGDVLAGDVVGALREGAATGRVGPFLRQRAAVADTVDRSDLERLHPQLAQIWWPPSATHSADGPEVEALTPRERTILDLLPTHLSYADMGEQLFISVNTVKTGVKSLYRKLGAASRSQAVDRAREAGLLPG